MSGVDPTTMPPPTPTPEPAKIDFLRSTNNGNVATLIVRIDEQGLAEIRQIVREELVKLLQSFIDKPNEMPTLDPRGRSKRRNGPR
jgi:hypothetical protein